jgi:hypothetical protein
MTGPVVLEPLYTEKRAALNARSTSIGGGTIVRSKLRALGLIGSAAAAMAVGGVLVASVPAVAASGHPAGVIGSPIKLAGGQLMQSLGHPYDVAANSTGTAYIGWVSSTQNNPTEKVHLCTLPPTATACAGGIQTVDAQAATSAGDLHIVITDFNEVHLLWFHDTLSGGAIGEAIAQNGANLTTHVIDATTPSSVGSLLAAESDAGGNIWTVTYDGQPAQNVQVRDGIGNAPVDVSTPFTVSYAQLSFAAGIPVLAIERAGGAITAAPRYATRSSGGVAWSSFHPVANTWAVGTNAALETTGHGLRIVTAIDNATYRPVIARWTGSGFTPRRLTADTNSCAPSSHDGWADASGRLLDVSWECNKVTVTNYADALHAGITRFGVSATPTHAPQAASGTRGIATVAYTVEDTGGGETLRVARVRLPDPTVTVSHHATGGRVTVTGPRSCLPPVNVHVGWTHHPDANWTFLSGSLRLGNSVVTGSTLDGAQLTSGTQYTLTGTATFGRGGNRNTVNVSLDFRTCGTS